MKRKLLLAAVTLFAAVFSGGNSISATDWTGNAPAAGTYYLYNVGADRFLGYGANWGSRATVEHAGIPVTLTKVSDGVYTITTNVVENGKMLNVNGYVDSDPSNWTFTSVAGETNTYQISSDGKYIFWDGTIVNYTTSVDASLPSTVANSYWKLVTTADRDAAFAAMNATEAAPLDITYKYIENPNTTYFTNIYSDANPWGGSSWKLGGYQNWADAKDQCGERFNIDFDSYIEIDNIPNGEYEFGVQGFYRDGEGPAAIQNYHDNNFTANAKIYANSNTTDMQSIAVANRTTEFNSTDSKKEISGTTYYVPNNQYMAEVYIYAGYYGWQNVRTVVTDGTLKFGVKKESTIANDWTIVDKFYLSYLGPTIDAKAVALPEGGAMEANQWYYFDINAAANNYTATATKLDDIVFTTAGTTLIKNQGTVTDKFDATNNSLAAQRYYVKSSSDNQLVIGVPSYTYSVGTAAANIAYIQPDNTITVSYNVGTNEPGATLTQNYSGVTFNGVAIEVTETTSGFTFTVPNTVTANNQYTLFIPAGAIKYNDEEGAKNAEQQITFITPAVFDGTYYLYDATNAKFISRGANYGTRATVDKYGTPFHLVTDGNGASLITFVDWEDSYMFFDNEPHDNCWIYSDGGSNRGDNRLFAFEATQGGYYLRDAAKNVYIRHDNSVLTAPTTNIAEATVWTLKDKNERDEIVATYPSVNKQDVITASGIETTAAEFDAYLASNFISVDMTSVVGTAKFTDGIAARRATTVGDWTWTETRGKDGNNDWEKSPAYGANFAEAWCATGKYTQTISSSNLPAGIYKLTVDGFERRATTDISNSLGAAGYNLVSSYLAANGEQVRLTDWYDIDTKPGNAAAAIAAFDAGKATNEVYIYLNGSTDLEITLGKPNYVWDTWTIFNNFTLTRFDAKATTAEKEALADAITVAEGKTLGFETEEYAPYNNVSGCEALAAAQAINPDNASSEAVVAATTALNNATWTANVEDVDAVYDGDLANATIQATSEDVVLAGWVTKNGARTRQTFKGNGENGKACLGENEVGLFVYPGTYNYGETTGYTMPLKAGCLYVAEAKYCSWADNSNGNFTLTILNGSTTVATKSFGANKTGCANANAFKSVKLYFTPSEDADYTLSVGIDGNTFMTGFHITKLTSVTIDEDDAYDYTQSGEQNVILNRTINEGANTLVLPFSMTQAEVETNFGEGAKVYVVSGFNTKNETITFKEQDGIAANVPCVLEATVAGSSFVLTNRTLEAMEPNTSPAKTKGGITMLGSYAEEFKITMNNNNYIFYNGNLYLVDSDNVYLRNTRAYFHVEALGSRVLSVSFEGGKTTEIAEIESEETEDGLIYNLAGQVVGPDYKGIAIINGKKVMMK